MDESNRRKLEFKKLLIRLGEKMSAKDEENIRFLYEEDMNQDVSKPTDLFRELLQKGTFDTRCIEYTNDTMNLTR